MGACMCVLYMEIKGTYGSISKLSDTNQFERNKIEFCLYIHFVSVFATVS